jgi:hypothetical protein
MIAEGFAIAVVGYGFEKICFTASVGSQQNGSVIRECKIPVRIVAELKEADAFKFQFIRSAKASADR